MGSEKNMTNDAIACAALEYIDVNGLDALSFRKLGEACGTPTMTICNRFGSKDALLRAVLKIMLEEHPNYPIEGETWEDSLRRIARHHREMALAHPNAFALFLQIPPYESPILEYTQQMFEVHRHQHLPENMPFVFLSIMHSFLPGFQLAESFSSKVDLEQLSEQARRFATLFNEQTFERNIEIIIAGLESKYHLSQKANRI